MEKVSLTEDLQRLPVGVSCIDNVMGGGLEPKVITELFGEGGSGKTNLSMQFTISALKSGKAVIYLDTEGFSTERFLQMCGNDRDIVANMMLYRIESLDDQELAIMRSAKMFEKNRKIGLMVVDSFTEYFRLEKSADYSARIAGFQKQLNMLSSIALKNGIPVLMTNQIYHNVESNQLQPFGGFIIDHVMKAIFKLEKVGMNKRKISVSKHRSLPEGNEGEFRIIDYGITCEG